MKIIRDEITTICCVFIGILLLSLSISHCLSPEIFGILLIFEIILLYLTKFNETSPSPWLHFTRVYESVFICGPILSGLFYYFTWFVEDMNSIASIRAQLSVLYCYSMFIYVILCSVPIIGIYFNFRMLIPWSVNVLETLYPQDDPIIIAPGIMLFFLMGFGIMFTQHVFLFTALRGNKSFGSSSEFKRIGLFFGLFTLILGIIWIIFQEWIEFELLNQIRTIRLQY